MRQQSDGSQPPNILAATHPPNAVAQPPFSEATGRVFLAFCLIEVAIGLLAVILEGAASGTLTGVAGAAGLPYIHFETGIWVGFIGVLAGIFGCFAWKKNHIKGLFVAHMTTAIILAVASLFLMLFPGINTGILQSCSSVNASLCSDARIQSVLHIQITLIFCGIVLLACGITSSSLCCGTMCCKDSPKPYTQQPQIIFAQQHPFMPDQMQFSSSAVIQGQQLPAALRGPLLGPHQPPEAPVYEAFPDSPPSYDELPDSCSRPNINETEIAPTQQVEMTLNERSSHYYASVEHASDNPPQHVSDNPPQDVSDNPPPVPPARYEESVRACASIQKNSTDNPPQHVADNPPPVPPARYEEPVRACASIQKNVTTAQSHEAASNDYVYAVEVGPPTIPSTSNSVDKNVVDITGATGVQPPPVPTQARPKQTPREEVQPPIPVPRNTETAAPPGTRGPPDLPPCPGRPRTDVAYLSLMDSAIPDEPQNTGKETHSSLDYEAPSFTDK